MTEELKEKISDYCVTLGYNGTMEGNYHVGFDEVAEEFHIPEQEVIDNKDDIAGYIDEHEEILSETWVDEDFDMNFCFDDCIGHATLQNMEQFRAFHENKKDVLTEIVDEINEYYDIEIEIDEDKPFEELEKDVWKIYNKHLQGELSEEYEE